MKLKNITKLCFIFQINSPLLREVFPSLKLTENFKKFHVLQINTLHCYNIFAIHFP